MNDEKWKAVADNCFNAVWDAFEEVEKISVFHELQDDDAIEAFTAGILTGLFSVLLAQVWRTEKPLDSRLRNHIKKYVAKLLPAALRHAEGAKMNALGRAVLRAKREIDKRFGDGTSKNNPEMICALVQAEIDQWVKEDGCELIKGGSEP
jgi:hypothetical protein